MYASQSTVRAPLLVCRWPTGHQNVLGVDETYAERNKVPHWQRLIKAVLRAYPLLCPQKKKKRCISHYNLQQALKGWLEPTLWTGRFPNDALKFCSGLTGFPYHPLNCPPPSFFPFTLFSFSVCWCQQSCPHGKRPSFSHTLRAWLPCYSLENRLFLQTNKRPFSQSPSPCSCSISL